MNSNKSTELATQIIKQWRVFEESESDEFYNHPLNICLVDAKSIEQGGVAYEVLEATVEMVIQELMTGEVGLQVLQEINNFRVKRGDHL
jgi:hypothetical protein